MTFDPLAELPEAPPTTRDVGHGLLSGKQVCVSTLFSSEERRIAVEVVEQHGGGCDIMAVREFPQWHHNNCNPLPLPKHTHTHRESYFSSKRALSHSSSGDSQKEGGGERYSPAGHHDMAGRVHTDCTSHPLVFITSLGPPPAKVH